MSSTQGPVCVALAGSDASASTQGRPLSSSSGWSGASRSSPNRRVRMAHGLLRGSPRPLGRKVRRLSEDESPVDGIRERGQADPLRPAGASCTLATGVASPPERGGPQPDGDFLEEIFEIQMMSAADPDAARGVAVRRMWDTHRQQLDEAFRAHESGDGTLDGVEMILAKLQYLNTARTQTGA